MRVDAEYSTRPVVLSILFHLCVVTVIMIGWPFLTKPAPTAQPLVIIDVVKLAPDTNLSAQSGKAMASPEPEQEATRRKPPPPPPPPPTPPSPATDNAASATPAPKRNLRLLKFCLKSQRPSRSLFLSQLLHRNPSRNPKKPLNQKQ